MTTRLLISLRNPIDFRNRAHTHEGTLKLGRKMRRCGIMARSFLSYGLAICFVGVVLIMGFQFFRSDSSKMDVKKSIYASHRGNRKESYAEHRSPSFNEIKDDTMKPEKNENGPITLLKETVKEPQQEPHEDPFFSIKKESPISEESSTTSTTASSSEQQQQNKPNNFNNEDAAEGKSEDKLKISSTTNVENLAKPEESELKEGKESKGSSSKEDSSTVEPIIKKSSSEASDDTLDESNKEKSKGSLDESTKEEPSGSADDKLDESVKKEKLNESTDDFAAEERDVSKNYNSLKKINSKKSYYTTQDSLPVPIKRRKFIKPYKKSSEGADDTLDESKKLEKPSSSDDLANKEEEDPFKSKYSLKEPNTKEFEKSSEKVDLTGSLDVSINDEKDKPNTKDDLTAQDK